LGFYKILNGFYLNIIKWKFNQILMENKNLKVGSNEFLY
jgi:hypothetical protein